MAVIGGAAWVLQLGSLPAAAAVRQSWPAFALVTGLILVGKLADREGVFAAVGVWLARRVGGHPIWLLVAVLGLVAAVTAVLNLDTSVVFLTPVLIHAARARQLDERPFVYGAVFMSNSASLLLPGSNLTNLIVLSGSSAPVNDFAQAMLLPWLAAVVITGGLVWLLHHGGSRGGSPAPRSTVQLRGHLGLIGIAAASTLVVVMRDPALPVLLVCLVLTAWSSWRERSLSTKVLRALPVELGLLFVVAVALGTAARLIEMPHILLDGAGPWLSLGVGAVGAVLMNNLPAAAVLAAHHPAAPLFLLLGLNLGPNLSITGSLAAVLWLRVARQHGATPSIVRYSLLGLIIAPFTLAAAAAARSVSWPLR